MCVILWRALGREGVDGEGAAQGEDGVTCTATACVMAASRPDAMWSVKIKIPNLTHSRRPPTQRPPCASGAPHPGSLDPEYYV
eukprot:686530-Prymnesium_polylepis.1